MDDDEELERLLAELTRLGSGSRGTRPASGNDRRAVMGHKPWDMPERRAERRRGDQRWKAEVADELVLTPLADVVAELGLTDDEIRAAAD